MNQTLFSEYRTMYSTTKESPAVIRIKIRMRDLIDPECMRFAVDSTMPRYPYFCVELKNRDGNKWEFAENNRPVVITNSLSGVELNSEASNYHMLSFSWQDNWIIIDIFHALTDGTGAYELVRTFLYYYCSKRYNTAISDEGVRLAGDVIGAEEWEDPVLKADNLPEPPRVDMPNAFSPAAAANLENDTEQTVYSIAIDEKEFMRFNIDNDGSPATMISLLLSRAIAKLFPEHKDVIRITLAVNQRGGLGAPKARQSLVGGAFLEYTDKLKDWQLDRQATAYRGMAFAQTTEEAVLTGAASQKGINQMLLSKETDQERLAIAGMICDMTKRLVTATVSYVGKAGFLDSEEYIRDFRLWTSSTGTSMLLETSAVGGRFTIDFIQPFSSPIFVNAFLEELENNGIKYDLQDVMKLELPNVRLPWTE